MGMGLAGLNGAGGTKDAIAQILAQRLLEAKLAEETRSNKATESNRADQVRLASQDRADALKERQQTADEARVMKAVTMRQHGGEVTPSEQATEMAAGVPSSNYAPHDANMKSVSLSGFSSLPGAASQMHPDPTAAPVQPSGAMDMTENPARAKGSTWNGYTPQEIQLAQLSSIAGDRTADNARADASGKEAHRHNVAMENKPPAGSSTLVPVKTKDPITGKTVTKFVVKHEGDSYESPESATSQNRADSAQAVNQTGNDIIAELSDPSVRNMIGPALGRYNTLRDFIGDPPPELSKLAGQIESFALANMGVHGMRSAQGAEHIKGLLDKKHTPESMVGAIQGLMGFSQHFLANAGRKVDEPTGPKAPQAPAGWKYVPKDGGGWTAVEDKGGQ